jgi:hypothetical protein
MTPAELLRDAFVRVIAVNEALDYGDVDEARAVASDLEHDLARALGADKWRYVCACGATFRWPGERDHHERMSGHDFEAAA